MTRLHGFSTFPPFGPLCFPTASNLVVAARRAATTWIALTSFRLLDNPYRLKWCSHEHKRHIWKPWRFDEHTRFYRRFGWIWGSADAGQVAPRGSRSHLQSNASQVPPSVVRSQRLVAVVSWFIPRVFFCNFQQGTSGTPDTPGTCLLVYHWIVLDGQFSRFVHSHYTHTATSEGGRRQELKSWVLWVCPKWAKHHGFTGVCRAGGCWQRCSLN